MARDTLAAIRALRSDIDTAEQNAAGTSKDDVLRLLARVARAQERLAEWCDGIMREPR